MIDDFMAAIPVVFQFRQTLTPETDRGCALMAAAFLDDKLQALLRQCMVSDIGMANEMLRPGGPLGAFSARIDMAFLLGAIGAKCRRDLDLIRKIRNEFAHDASPIDFDHEPIAARCRELSNTVYDVKAAPRDRFVNASLGVLGQLEAARLDRERPAPANEPDKPPMTKAQLERLAKSLLEGIRESDDASSEEE